MAVMGTPADGCDITPLLPFKKRIPDAPPNVKEVQEGGGMEKDQGEGWRARPVWCNGAFPLHGMTRIGMARYGTARFGLRFHCSLVLL